MDPKDISPKSPDIGDFMKVFACTAVIMQSVLGLVLNPQLSYFDQNIIGIIYNLVKFTAPTFIFGILFTTIRTCNHESYINYLKKQWSALFIPTILWSLTYLIFMPNVQQKQHFVDFKSFIWQFINGNAAPHLWYNTMMLQFIILMPFFWALLKIIKSKPNLIPVIVIITFLGYGLWLLFYDIEVFHGVHSKNWYLLDRVFLSFIIYAILGLLSAGYIEQFIKFINRLKFFLIPLLVIVLLWTNSELFQFGYPVKLSNAPYYKPSMVLYSLTIISIISVFSIHKLQLKTKSSQIFHFLAVYAYRSYLSNVFWLQIIWYLFGKDLAQINPLLAIFIIYPLTWLFSFISAYYLHVLWRRLTLF